MSHVTTYDFSKLGHEPSLFYNDWGTFAGLHSAFNEDTKDFTAMAPKTRQTTAAENQRPAKRQKRTPTTDGAACDKTVLLAIDRNKVAASTTKSSKKKAMGVVATGRQTIRRCSERLRLRNEKENKATENADISGHPEKSHDTKLAKNCSSMTMRAEKAQEITAKVKKLRNRTKAFTRTTPQTEAVQTTEADRRLGVSLKTAIRANRVVKSLPKRHKTTPKAQDPTSTLSKGPEPPHDSKLIPTTEKPIKHLWKDAKAKMIKAAAKYGTINRRMVWKKPTTRHSRRILLRDGPAAWTMVDEEVEYAAIQMLLSQSEADWLDGCAIAATSGADSNAERRLEAEKSDGTYMKRRVGDAIYDTPTEHSDCRNEPAVLPLLPEFVW
ncbi:hypothetical protein DFP72DRAFT_1068826 [Ephemerocybe angulata]|uniref:Uncharacterized protein n=1 Tax=Ephemerocybe angulata TaxID=980116 RepID=A0A8H6HVH1_9AGAR|nr:hypothetical protein DFP72DRAFT_1068826 [Tulosesus angulatus]